MQQLPPTGLLAQKIWSQPGMERPLTGMRELDHKFEWTRRQFEDWSGMLECEGYRVRKFDSIGLVIGDEGGGAEELGHATQACVLELVDD